MNENENENENETAWEAARLNLLRQLANDHQTPSGLRDLAEAFRLLHGNG